MKTIVGLFDEKKDGEAVYDRLEKHGISSDRLHKIKGGLLHSSGYDKLKELGVPHDQACSFAEGLRRGGEIIACVCDDSEVDRVLPYFEEHRLADMDQRVKRWRSQGWSGYDRNAGALDQNATAAERQHASQETVIPVVEEQLRIGKRDIGANERVHVKTTVHEVPVQENVTLRQERVDVERRPADRPLTAGDQPFQERSFDVSAKREQAVVAKEARVVEEVVVKKDVHDAQQTIRDTVKKTEVKVDRGARDSRQSVP